MDSTSHSNLATRRLSGALMAAAALSAVVIVSAVADNSVLGAPRQWPWLLTGLQVLALWSAGRRFWWGWLLGGSVQLPWIAYAVMTRQVGFIPGCLISTSVQLFSFYRSTTSPTPMEAKTWQTEHANAQTLWSSEEDKPGSLSAITSLMPESRS